MQKVGKKTVPVLGGEKIVQTKSSSSSRTPESDAPSVDITPMSSAEDRARFAKALPDDALSTTSMLLTRGHRPTDGIDLSGVLSSDVAAELTQALTKASGPVRVEAEAALTRLAKSPIAERIAISILTGESLQDIAKGKVRFLGATRSKPAVAKALAAWGRAAEVRQGLAGLHGALSSLLAPVLIAHEDPRAVRAALRWIDLQLESAGNSTGIVARLIDAGCLPTDNWSEQTSFLPGSDPIGVLAKANRAADPKVVRSEVVEAYEQRFRTEGLTQSKQWTRTQDLVNHRGIVGEALRMAQLADDPRLAGRRIEQGVYLLETPDGLDGCKTIETALAWCEAHGRKSNRLVCLEVGGALQFGFRSTEIDALVLDEVEGQLRFLRIENVKAGSTTAGKAKQQCETAVASIADPAIQIYFEKPDGGFEDVSSRVDRRPETLAAIQLVTVGPQGDPQFDEHLPLSSGDVTVLAERLRAES